MGKGTIKIKDYPETHQQGLITIEQDLRTGGMEGDFGIQIAKDGRIWICINGIAVIRFKPLNIAYIKKEAIDSLKKKTRKKKDFCVLPTCSRCNERLHNRNSYKRADGRFITYCKPCNVNETIIKNWKKKSFNEINNQIKHYNHLIELLYEASNRKMKIIKRKE